jgi:head-tail adaptor
MLNIPVGQLDQRVTIELATSTRNDLGEEIVTWAELGGAGNGQRWARVREQSGREFLKGDFQAEGKAVFTLRWLTIDSQARLRWGDRVWMIEDATGDYRGGYVFLHCRSLARAN